MQRSIKLPLAVLFAVLSASLVLALSDCFRDRIKAIDQTQASRTRIQAQIDYTLHRRYAGQILETRLLGRCGFSAYVVTLRDAAGGEFTLFFDIDSGAPIRHNLLNGCPRHMSGPTSTRSAHTGPSL